MDMWLKQYATIEELKKSKDSITKVSEAHERYGKTKCEAVRDDSVLKGEVFDVMRQRFRDCECSIADDYKKYLAFLNAAYQIHMDNVEKIFADAPGTRWYMNEIESQIDQLRRNLASIDQYIAALERQVKHLSTIVPMCSDILINELKILKQKILKLKEDWKEQLAKLENRKFKMSGYNEDSTIVEAYDNAINLGNAIAVDITRLQKELYNFVTGVGAFTTPKEFGKERKNFWVEWQTKEAEKKRIEAEKKRQEAEKENNNKVYYSKKLEEFKSEFPQNSRYSSKGYSGAIQCMGFATQIYDYFYGPGAFSDGNNDIITVPPGYPQAGDYVRFHKRDGYSTDHSIFILKVENNIVYYADANGDSKNTVDYTKSMPMDEFNRYMDVNRGLEDWKGSLPETLRNNGVPSITRRKQN